MLDLKTDLVVPAETAQQLRALPALAENPRSVSSTIFNSSSVVFGTHSWLSGHSAHMCYRNTSLKLFFFFKEIYISSYCLNSAHEEVCLAWLFVFFFLNNCCVCTNPVSLNLNYNGKYFIHLWRRHPYQWIVV